MLHRRIETGLCDDFVFVLAAMGIDVCRVESVAICKYLCLLWRAIFKLDQPVLAWVEIFLSSGKETEALYSVGGSLLDAGVWSKKNELKKQLVLSCRRSMERRTGKVRNLRGTYVLVGGRGFKATAWARPIAPYSCLQPMATGMAI